MEKSLLAKRIVETCRLTGRFTLRSGKISSEYFDKYRFEAHPPLLRAVARLMAPLIPPDTEGLAGLEMGGIPLVTALSLETDRPARFVRKTAKPHGTRQLCEGGDIQGKTLCLIEDVITTGGQVLQSVQDLRSAGAKVHTALCVIYRGGGDLSPFEAKGLKVFPLFTKKDLLSTDSVAEGAGTV